MTWFRDSWPFKNDCILEFFGAILMTWYQFFEPATSHQCVFFWLVSGAVGGLWNYSDWGSQRIWNFKLRLNKYIPSQNGLLRWASFCIGEACCIHVGFVEGNLGIFFYFTSKFVPIILSFPGYIWSIYRFQVDKMRSHRRIRISSCEIGRRQKRSKSKGQIAANQKPEAGSAKKSPIEGFVNFGSFFESELLQSDLPHCWTQSWLKDGIAEEAERWQWWGGSFGS